jgi:hypothetical protein
MKRLLLVAAVSIPAFAFTFGGWATTTVENVPEFAVSGKPFELTYSVRQHGMGLLTKLGGAITISGSGVSQNFGVVEVGEGMYKSQVSMPSAGLWTIQVHSGFGKSGTTFTVPAVAALAARPSPMLPYDRGKQLFMAKGCANCHSHQLTQNLVASPVGQDLSEPKFSNAYLARFLANPSVKTDWKTQWRMPNLGLKPAEISALTAFLNQEKTK